MRRNRSRVPALLALVLAPAFITAALAQTTAPSTGASPPADAGPSLSEKLNRTDGVIAPPPSGDTDMTQRPPNVGTMPVIPPQAVTPPGQTPGAPKPEPK
jgi:hypothetical protein